MDYQTILVERIGRTSVITLNRPEVMNCVNARATQELGHAMEAFANDPDQWVAILTGAGARAFCAGADLRAIAAGEFKDPPEAYRRWGFAGVVRHYVSKPVIAAVNGFALGGGTELALACDLVVASEHASFGLPEVRRGIVAAAGGLLRLPRQIPLKIAMHCALTGLPLSADEACRWGLVNQVVAPASLMDAALRLAARICENAPLAVRCSKDLIYRGLDTALDFPAEAWELNAEYCARLMASEDAREGPRAFVEKRPPVWSAR
ncbi:crotonase/enoyl-CoA hydratase family protein [Frateuria aurantia]